MKRIIFTLMFAALLLQVANAQRNANTLVTQITTAAELEQISTDAATQRGAYILMNDIEVSQWKPISNFKGAFNGNGHTVTIKSVADTLNAITEDFSVRGTGIVYKNMPICNIGIFTTLQGTVKNLRVRGEISIEKLNTIRQGTFYGNQVTVTLFDDNISTIRAGGIAGTNNGRIQNCISDLKINIRAVKKTVDVRIYYRSDKVEEKQSAIIGGIAGVNNGVISDSYAIGSIVSAGDGMKYLGGIAGDNVGNIFRSYCTGSVAAQGEGICCAGGITGANKGALVNCVAMNQSITAEGEPRNDCGVGALAGMGSNYDRHKSYALKEIAITETYKMNPPKPKFMVSRSATEDEAFWQRQIKGYDISFAFGAEEAKPWMWDSAAKRPRLYWEPIAN
ncbi:MAG: hypothetical protein LBS01_08560 [Prevotellaceae bacterium]|jgi:hypothetical protein|nr:hypothetical protein [Prevotellaceae bacterium]